MARKMSAVARAELGHPRECDTCGDEKEVSEKTFALFRKGLRGWHTTCRVCQGVEKSTQGSPNGTNVNSGDITDDLVAEMYDLHFASRNPGRIEEISAELRARVLEVYDTGDHEASFRMFIDIVKPIIAGWKTPGTIHDDIIAGLMSKHRRRLVIATRYSAKSTLTGIYVAWRIMCDPLIKILVVSRGSKLAARMLRTVRRVFIEQCPMLHHLRPTDDCLDNAEQYQTPQSLTVATGGVTLTSLGMGSNLPGFRSDLTIGDDVEGPQEDTPEKVVQLEEDLNELHMINPRGEKILLGTYQSEFSLYAKLADLTTHDGEPVWETHRALMFEEDVIDGKVVIHSRWPEMFSDDDGIDWRKGVTQRAWRLHVLLIADPSILNERPLKISDLPVLKANPLGNKYPVTIERSNDKLVDLPRWSAPKGDDWYAALAGDTDSPPAVTVMAVDPASGLAGRDAIGVAVLSITPGGFGIIRHLEGVRAANKADSMRRVATIARDFSASVLVIEELKDGFFGETLEGQLVILGYPMSVEKVTTGGQQKGRRIIEALAPPMGAGRLVILEQVATSDHGGEFVNQLVRISYDGRTGSSRDHDDIVDALAHAVARVKDSLISDIAENRAMHRQEQLDHWARTPMRYGGLGGGDAEEFQDTNRAYMGRTDAFGGEYGQTYADSLLQEDEVMISMVERRDRLQEVVNEDLRFGRKPDLSTISKIRTLTAQITELKEAQVF